MAVDTAVRARNAEIADQRSLVHPKLDRRRSLDAVDVTTSTTRRDTLFRRGLLAADLLAFAIAGLLAVHVANLRPGSALLAVLVVLASKTMRLYDRDQALIAKRSLDEVPALFHLATLVTLVFWLGHSFFVKGALPPDHVLVVWGVLFAALPVCRALARRFTTAVAQEERCLVLAESHEHRRVDDKFSTDPRLRTRVVVHLPLVERRADSDHPPHVALEHCVRAFGVNRVVIAPDGVEPGVVLDAISRATALGVNVSVLPRICEVIGSSLEFDDLGGMTLLGVRPFKLARSSAVIKRAVDLVGAIAGLLIGAPVFAAIAVAIKLDTRGPVLFRQTRVGRDGERFAMLKFRSMVDGAHGARQQLAEQSHGRGLFKLTDDPRVTRVGRFLRRTSLDELPQLLNVVRGEMSLVGPRPLVVEEDERVVGHHRRRLRIQPGLTGPWQVLGSPDVRVGLEEMATIDYLYTVNWSLWTDIQVLLRTVGHVFARRGV